MLEKFNWPRPPLILGLVLGGLAESRLFLSVGNYGMSWLWRPMVLVLIAVTLFGAFYPVVKARLAKTKYRSAAADDEGRHNVVTARKVNKWSALFAFGLLAVISVALFQSRSFNVRAGLFPWVVGFPLMLLLLVQLAKELMGKASARTRLRQGEEEDQEMPPDEISSRTAGMFGWIVGYLIAIWLLGFPAGCAVCSFIQLKFGSGEKWPVTIVLTVGIWAFVYLLFERTLLVPFPPGQIFEALGMAE
jgi:uncharacterized integral membrane protein